MTNINKSFGNVHVLNNVNFELKAGEVHSLLGENGAGKSTLIKILGGIYSKDSGDIEINGNHVDIHSVKDAVANGIAIIHQELVLVPYMTVAENMFLGREPMKGKFVNFSKMSSDAQELIDKYKLNINAKSLVRDLPIAMQQMVEIIKALSTNSKIIVMDEPTSSISDQEVSLLFSTMKELTKQGIGIIYISHKMSEIFDICDRVTVLRDGNSIATKNISETNRDELVALMVGRKLDNYYIRDYCSSKEVVFKAEGITDGSRCKNVSFNVKKGEIVGFAGLVGCGRSETMQAIFGLSKNSKGTVQINGKKLSIHNPVEAVSNGIAMVPENRKEEGLYLIETVEYNTTIEVLKEFLNHLKYDRDKEADICEKYNSMMNTKYEGFDQTVNNLSGGNQQKVLIGRWLATKPKLLILDEPTRGVDVGAKAEIYEIMNDLAKSGVSIIMVSSELPEILNMSDRVYVMSDGEIKGCLEHGDLSQEKIMQLAAN